MGFRINKKKQRFLYQNFNKLTQGGDNVDTDMYPFICFDNYSKNCLSVCRTES